MTANFRQFECAVCHDPIQYGQYLPFAHTNGRPRNARAHYARPLRTPKGSAEVNASFPFLASEEPRPTLSRPDVGVVTATSHRASSTG